jgi:hypothetical protein
MYKLRHLSKIRLHRCYSLRVRIRYHKFHISSCALARVCEANDSWIVFLRAAGGTMFLIKPERHVF